VANVNVLHRRWVLPGLILAAVAGLAVLGLAVVRPWPQGRKVYSGEDGPLPGATARTRNVIAVPIGQVRSWAMVILEDRKGRGAVIDGFRTRPPLVGGGIHLRAAYMANDPGRQIAGQGPMEGPPSPEKLGPLVQVEGARVPHSDRGAALVLEVELTRAGLFWIEGVDVDFHIGGRKYTVKNETGLVLCGPKSVLENCPTFEDRPSEGCATLGFVPFGRNGCVPASPAPS
jgi:hypothetical protein